jgi:energy-converting hydrogenase A subunit M
MPEPLWISLMALLYFTNITTCSAMSDAFASASHAQLTRMLQGTWSGQTLFNLAWRILFTIAGGYLILDDTVVEKPYARLLGEAAWVWSSRHRKVVFGVSRVLLVWTDGQVRIPLAFRRWQKAGPSKFDRALEMLSSARNRLRCKPQFVLFDSWYPSKKLLKRLRDYGWDFVCQLKKHRRFAGQPFSRYLQQPYGHATGYVSGDLKVLVVRYRRKYYATNRLRLRAKEVRPLYRKRQEVEEVIRVLKDQRSLAGCQAGYKRCSGKQGRPREGAQEHHIALCLVAYLLVERERLDHGDTWRQRKRQLILTGLEEGLPALERLRRAA